MIGPLRSLRGIAGALVLCAFASGAVMVWLWMGSNSDWRTYQQMARSAGVAVYHSLQDGTAAPEGIAIFPLSGADATSAETGAFHLTAGAPRAARETRIPLSADPANPRTSAPLTLVILSPDLVYPISGLTVKDGQSAAQTTGEVFRLLASLCSDPLVLAQFGTGPWHRIDGAQIWGCAASPADWRLAAALLGLIALAALMTVSQNLSADFTAFAAQLRNRRRLGGPDSYAAQGPSELQDIVTALNAYLETERAQLENRAAVLSGVSHDLGSPATRLRLRAALIEDAALRSKLEADIDSMTGMIDSVLTYTRTEMNAEAPRKLSLTALIDSIVANYADMGRAVTFRPPEDVIVHGARSVFMSRQGQAVVQGEREVTVTGRPIALERAMGNLIDNALKYGRRATVSLRTDANTATIIVEDEGSDMSASDLEALMAPYTRGTNTATIQGYGLGLTIVAAIANLHGGTLTFEDTAAGLAAHLMIQRG